MKISKILCPVCENTALIDDPTAIIGWRRLDTAGSVRIHPTGIVEVTCCHCGASWKFGVTDDPKGTKSTTGSRISVEQVLGIAEGEI